MPSKCSSNIRNAHFPTKTSPKNQNRKMNANTWNFNNQSIDNSLQLFHANFLPNWPKWPII